MEFGIHGNNPSIKWTSTTATWKYGRMVTPKIIYLKIPYAIFSTKTHSFLTSVHILQYQFHKHHQRQLIFLLDHFEINFLSISTQLLRTHQRHHREYNKAIMNGFRQIFNKLCHFEISSQNGIMVLFTRQKKTLTEILIPLITVELWKYYSTNTTRCSRTVLPRYYLRHPKPYVPRYDSHFARSHESRSIADTILTIRPIITSLVRSKSILWQFPFCLDDLIKDLTASTTTSKWMNFDKYSESYATFEYSNRK